MNTFRILKLVFREPWPEPGTPQFVELGAADADDPRDVIEAALREWPLLGRGRIVLEEITRKETKS